MDWKEKAAGLRCLTALYPEGGDRGLELTAQLTQALAERKELEAVRPTPPCTGIWTARAIRAWGAAFGICSGIGRAPMAARRNRGEPAGA